MKMTKRLYRLMLVLVCFLCVHIMAFTYYGLKKLDIIIDNQETIISIQAENIRQSFLLRAEIEEIKDFWQGDDMIREKKKVDLKDKSWKKEKK